MSATNFVEVAQQAGIGVEPVGGKIGAVIRGVDLRKPLSSEALAAVRQALHRHLVVFVRGQDLSDDEHIAAAAQLGVPNVYPVTRARGIDQPLEFIEDTPEDPPKTDLWHTDVAYIEQPPELAMIQMRETPPAGGDTLWCSLYAAHDRLSPRMQSFAADLDQDLHPGEIFREITVRQFGEEIFAKVADELSGTRHPLVRIHPETGRRALFLCGDYFRGLTGLDAVESRLLYDHFRGLLEDPNGQCRWRWKLHDVAIWDERCTNHRALSDHYPARRRVRRCTIGASRPLGPRAAREAGIDVAPLPPIEEGPRA